MRALDSGLGVLARGFITRWLRSTSGSRGRKVALPERQALVRVAGNNSEHGAPWQEPGVRAAIAGAVLACLLLAACDDSGNSDSGTALPPGTSQYSIGGTVSGLAGAGLLLQINGADNLNATTNGPFTFGARFGTGATYKVTVATQPSTPAQTCSVTNGSGTVSSNVANVSVVCTTTTAPTVFTIGGSVSGLAGTGLVLEDNGGDALPVTTDGAFTFSTALATGSPYAVTVGTQPGAPNQSCVVSAGSGTVASASITNIVVACRTIGKFAYTANNASKSVSGYAIDPTTGALTPIPGMPITVGSAPATVSLAPNEKFAYVATDAGTKIYGYSIDPASGVLTPVPGSPFTTRFVVGQPAPGISVDPQSRFLYLPSLNDGLVAGFAIDPTTGALTPVPGSPFVAGAGSSGLPAFSPNGKFLYVMNQNAASVQGYSIDSNTGALTAIAGGPFACGATPTWISFVPSGKFAYVSNSGANSVSAYAVNASTGALTPLPGSPFAAHTRPGDSTVDSTGTHLYVPNRYSNDISAYAIDPASGVLTALPGSPFIAGLGPLLLDIEATGRFAYASSSGGTDVYGYSIDPSTGALAPLAGSPFAAGTNPLFIIVDPSGKFAYAANNQSKNTSAYAIDAASGVLAPVAGGPFAAGVDPFVVSISPEAPGIRD